MSVLYINILNRLVVNKVTWISNIKINRSLLQLFWFKLNWFLQISRIRLQPHSSKNTEIIQIINTNYKLIIDENGQRQPCGLFKALGTNLVNEKDAIKRNRKRKFSDEEIPRDFEFIRLTLQCLGELWKRKQINK